MMQQAFGWQGVTCVCNQCRTCRPPTKRKTDEQLEQELIEYFLSRGWEEPSERVLRSYGVWNYCPESPACMYDQKARAASVEVCPTEEP